MWWSPAPMVKMSPMAGGRIHRTPPRMKSPISECMKFTKVGWHHASILLMLIMQALHNHCNSGTEISPLHC